MKTRMLRVMCGRDECDRRGTMQWTTDDDGQQRLVPSDDWRLVEVRRTVRAKDTASGVAITGWQAVVCCDDCEQKLLHEAAGEV